MRPPNRRWTRTDEKDAVARRMSTEGKMRKEITEATVVQLAVCLPHTPDEQVTRLPVQKEKPAVPAGCEVGAPGIEPGTSRV